ncbi:MAG: hypothetical protein QM538_02565 [Methylacidiphilales bacterium]|nr:hypothetical protein [Candidatus Methylacidiphilales bacterium]
MKINKHIVLSLIVCINTQNSYAFGGIDAAIIVAKMTEQMHVMIGMYNQIKNNYEQLQQLKRITENKTKINQTRNTFVDQTFVLLNVDNYNNKSELTGSDTIKDRIKKRLEEIEVLISKTNNLSEKNALQQEARVLFAQLESQIQIDKTQESQLGEQEALTQIARNTAQLLNNQGGNDMIKQELAEEQATALTEDISTFYQSIVEATKNTNNK